MHVLVRETPIKTRADFVLARRTRQQQTAVAFPSQSGTFCRTRELARLPCILPYPPHTTWQTGSAKPNTKSGRVVSSEKQSSWVVGNFLTTGIDQIPPLAWLLDLLAAAAEKLTFGVPSKDKRWLDLRRQMREMPRN